MQLKGFIKLNLKKRIIITIITFFFFIFIIIYFIIIPSVRDIKNIKNEIEIQRTDLERKYLKGQNLRRMSEKLKKAEEKIHILDQVFISQNFGLEFITTLEEVASRNNVTQKINLLSSLDPDDSLYKIIPIQLFSQGNFVQQLGYLVNLEILNYYINIKSLELSSNPKKILTSNEEVSQNNVDMLISADTYWQSE